MQVVLHTGAHCTDEDRLVKCLLRNKDEFRQEGIAVPGPSRYRQLLRDALHSMADAPLAEDAREVLLDAILDADEAHVDRLLLSNENFFCVPKVALARGQLYPMAVERLSGMVRLFAPERVELFMALRNPATFLPALFEAAPQQDFTDFLGGVDPLSLRWSELVGRLRDEVPEVPLTIWCNEDTPLIWGQVVREVAGLEPNRRITGAFDVLSEIMSKEGMQRFRAYLKEHPEMTEMQKRRVMAAFLDKFALPDEVEQELDVPGWTAALVDEMTEAYDEDVLAISRMHGVTLLAP